MRDALRHQEMLDNTHINELMNLYKCSLVRCPNSSNNGWCYPFEEVHLKVMPQQFKAWSIAINEGEASTETPPENLIKSLMPAKPGEVNPKRKPPKSPPKQSPTTPSTPATNTPSFYPFPMPPLPYFNPFIPQLPASNVYRDPWKKPSLSEQRTDPIDITIRSSPPSEVDPIDRLQKYINFLMNKSPSQSAMLLTAQDA